MNASGTRVREMQAEITAALKNEQVTRRRVDEVETAVAEIATRTGALIHAQEAWDARSLKERLTWVLMGR